MEENISINFAIEAEEMLQEGNYTEAINLCELGLKVYPNYLSAYSISTKALTYIGGKEKALDFVASIPNTICHYKMYNLLINNLKKQIDEIDLYIKGGIHDVEINKAFQIFQNSDIPLENNYSSDFANIDSINEIINKDNTNDFVDSDEGIDSFKSIDFLFDNADDEYKSKYEIKIDDVQIHNQFDLNDNIFNLTDEVIQASDQNSNEDNIDEMFDNLSQNEDYGNSIDLILNANNIDIIPGFENDLEEADDIYSIDTPKDETDFTALLESLKNADLIRSVNVQYDEDEMMEEEFTNDDLPITEEMAEILIKQNKNDLAINIFEKLILLNPEKQEHYIEKINSLN